MFVKELERRRVQWAGVKQVIWPKTLFLVPRGHQRRHKREKHKRISCFLLEFLLWWRPERHQHTAYGPEKHKGSKNARWSIAKIIFQSSVRTESDFERSTRYVLKLNEMLLIFNAIRVRWLTAMPRLVCHNSTPAWGRFSKQINYRQSGFQGSKMP